MLNINTNLSSLIAQKGINSSTFSLNKTIERISTSYKLNSASDNAANFSISTAITTQLSSYLVAEDNVMMGMDLLNTASTSINLISNQLQRIRELAVQANNGVLGETSLKAINTEINSRIDEIERLHATTEYNGIKFGGKEDEASFMNDITRRDTSSFVSFSSVKIDEELSSGTYSIKTAEELAKLATMTNNGLIGDNVEFVLGADIDLSNYNNWTPIGNSTNKFTGIFDGNGYTISNLTIKTSGSKLGLFGLTSKADIKNVGLEDINILLNGATTNDKHIGGLIGYLGADSTLTNCYVKGEIDARSKAKIVGGLVGQVYNGCIIEDCYSECDTLNVNSMGSALLGCLEKNSTLKNSYSNAKSTGSSYIGGLVGAALTTVSIENCYSSGAVTGNSSGGLIGSMHTNTTIKNSWTSTQVKANSGNSTAAVVYAAANSVIEDVYVFEENNNHSGIFVGTYRSGGSGNIIIKNCHYSDYYDNYSIPISTTNKVSITNVNTYDGEIPFKYSNESKIYTFYPDIKLQIGINSCDTSTLNINTRYLLKNIKKLRNIGIKSGDYISYCDKILKDLDSKELEFATLHNRLDYALDEISIKYDNLISTRSTLKDADIAEESSNFIRYQILQQASSTLLATANQAPMIALQLL